MASSLAHDTTPTPDPDVVGRFHLALSDAWSFLLPSGGVLTTTSLRAIALSDSARGPAPISATTVFCEPVRAGDVVIDVEVLRRGSTTLQAKSSLRQEGRLGLVTTATFARDREGPTVSPQTRPDLPGPDASRPWVEPTFTSLRSEIPFFTQVDQRIALGHRWWESTWSAGEARFARWFRYRSSQLVDGFVDPLALPPLADTMPPSLRQRLGPGAADVDAPSLDLTIHFLEPTTSEWLLIDARCRVARRGYASADVEVWGEDGKLAAFGTQTMFLRRPKR